MSGAARCRMRRSPRRTRRSRTRRWRNDVPVAKFVRDRILEIVRGRAAADISSIAADLAPLIERTFRYTYMLATQKRDELIQDGRGDEMEKLVKAARELQDSLLSMASE